MQNFLNSNEVYPILDLIRREMRRSQNKQSRSFQDKQSSGFFEKLPDYTSDDVEELKVLRDADDIVSSVITKYYDGVTEIMTLRRGYDPPVDTSVADYEFINTQLIMGYEMQVISPVLGDKFIIGTITREGGYGRITGLKQMIQ